MAEREHQDTGEGSALSEELESLRVENVELRHRLAIIEGKLKTVRILLESPKASHRGMTVKAAAVELRRRRRALPPRTS